MKLLLTETKKSLTRFILYFAIFMMILSAWLNYFYVLRLNPEIAGYKMSVEDKRNLIRDIWNNVIRRESKIDVVILLKLLQSQNNEETNKVINHYLNEYSEIPKNVALSEMLLALDQSKKTDLDYVDSIYLEQVAIQNKVNELEEKQKTYVNLAFFMQILSLLLIILRRDIFEDTTSPPSVQA